MIQELGMSAYGGGQVNKPRAMLAEEGKYDEDCLYATNDGERNPKPNGVRKDQKLMVATTEGLQQSSMEISCFLAPVEETTKLAGVPWPHVGTLGC